MSPTQQSLFTLLLHKVESSLALGATEAYTKSTYALASDEIYAKTRIKLSPDTLRRLFRKDNPDYFPQLETRNILARYAGYADWADFVRHHAQETDQAAPRPQAGSSPKALNSRPFHVKIALWVILLFSAALFAFFI